MNQGKFEFYSYIDIISLEIHISTKVKSGLCEKNFMIESIHVRSDRWIVKSCYHLATT